MTPAKFDAIVKNRADARVKEKIAKCERAISDALTALHRSLAPNFYTRYSGESKGTKDVRAIFRYLLNDSSDAPTGFPKIIWDEESAVVATEILATLDEISKALATPAQTEAPPIAQEPQPTK